MKQNWQDFFYYTKSERNGLILLSLICVGLFLAPYLFPNKEEMTTIDFSTFQKEVDLFMAPSEKKAPQKPSLEQNELFFFNPNEVTQNELEQLGLSTKTAQTILNFRKKGGRFFKKEDLKKIYGLSNKDYEKLQSYIQLPLQSKPSTTVETQKEEQTEAPIPTSYSLYPFDPNTASKEELTKLGLSNKASNILLNFRKKGGYFRKKEDLKKIFGITDMDYKRLEPYIKILEKPEIPKKSIAHQKNKEANTLIIDINQSNAEDWQKLKGIGPSYSKRIIKFRDKLGGFSNIQQVGETYGLPDSTFNKIIPFLKTSAILKTIDINKVSAKELQQHPYLNYRQASAIINYRNNHGPFQNAEDLNPIKALSENTLIAVKPYFSFK